MGITMKEQQKIHCVVLSIGVILVMPSFHMYHHTNIPIHILFHVIIILHWDVQNSLFLL